MSSPEEEDQKLKKNNKMSSDMRSVPDAKNAPNRTQLYSVQVTGTSFFVQDS